MAQPSIYNFDVSKIFIGNNEYKTATYTNTTGDPVTLTAGRLLGRIYTSNKVWPHTLTATDGSEMPLGVLSATHTVAAGDSVTLTFCTHGKVAREMVLLNSGDTMTSVLDEYMTSPATDYDRMGSIEDLIQRNTGIILVASTELSKTDNQ